MSPTPPSLPHHLEAERSVLGAVVATSGTALDSLADHVTSEQFYLVAHQLVFSAMLALYQAGRPVDLVLLVEQLRLSGTLERVGGPGYVASLADGVPTSTNLPHYAALIRSKAAARQVIGVANQLLASAYADEQEPGALLDEASAALLTISQAVAPSDPVAASDLVAQGYTWLEALSGRGGTASGLATGFTRLDAMLRGLQPGNLVLLGGRPSQGKSTIAAQVALHASQSVPVLFFSVEMSRQEQLFRLVATVAEVDGHRLQSGALGDAEERRIGPAMAALSGRRLWIDDTGAISPLQIRAKSRRHQAQHGLGLVIIDYLQLLQHGKADSREERVANTGRSLKHLARELNVPVLALAQLSRQVEQREARKPRLSDFRESGSLEQDCDVAILIHRPTSDDEAVVREVKPTELIVAKSRNGPTGSIELRWIGEQFRFEEVRW